ncbi:glutathione S-transferase T3-like [Panicum virgatum]|nr:glutathione S-transferase T3-like [Panicum virgatum]
MGDFFIDLNDAAQGVGVGEVSESSMSGSASKVGATRNKQTNFSAYEDNMLCKSWLEISCDPVVNTGQRKEAFWIRVLNRYNSKCGSYLTRTQKSIMSRWDHKAEVSKFSGYMAEMIRSNPSGMSDADKSVDAAADFASVEKHNFTLMHCWQILKDEPKWMELKRKMDTPQNSGSRENAPPPPVCSATFSIFVPKSPHQVAHQENVPWGGIHQKRLRRKLLHHPLSTCLRCMTYLFRRLSCSRKQRVSARPS